MKYIVDRLEEGYAVCETEQGEFIRIKSCKLPPEVKEGDILVQNCDLFYIDIEETKKREEHIKKLAEDLWI